MRRYLVVANRTLGGQHLLDAVHDVLAQPVRRAERERREDDLVDRLAQQHVADGAHGAGVAHLARRGRAELGEPGQRLVETLLGHGDHLALGPRR